MYAFCTVIALWRWRERLPECIGLNHHLVKVVALRALKRADIETHTCRHDPSEHHVSAAFCAGRAMDVKVDDVRQEIGFLHDASLLTLARPIGLGASPLSLWTVWGHQASPPS
jgi:hypothetical protein